MPNIRPFRALRPTPEYAEEVYIYHGDATDPDRASVVANANPNSLLNITHFIENLYEESAVKPRTTEKFKRMIDSGVLMADEKECFYAYRLSMANHSQTGLVACVDIEDYINDKVRRHEHTRVDKVHTQANQIDRLSGNVEPIILVYDSTGIDSKMIEDWAYSHDSIYDILDEGGIRHEIWEIDDQDVIQSIVKTADNLDAFYICDGHHRIEAAAEYYKSISSDPECNPEYKDASRYFLSVIFPSDEMLILDYNRAVKTLNGLTKEEFIERVKAADFDVELVGSDPIYPSDPGEFSMVIDDEWYKLTYTGQRDGATVSERLDVSILQDRIIKDILGIDNPKENPAIGFISGTKGIMALQDATRSGMAVAFAIYPPVMADIMAVADAGEFMPPKSTCFEPKPAGGLVMYRFGDVE